MKPICTVQWLGLGILVLVVGCATVKEDPSPTTIALDKSVHFVGPGGEDRSTPAGSYIVSMVAVDQLQLTPTTTDRERLQTTIAALPVTVPIKLEAPAAVTLAQEGDEHYIVWVRPDGTGLEATGTYSGVMARKDCDPACVQRAMQRLKQYYEMLAALQKARAEAANQIIRNLR